MAIVSLPFNFLSCPTIFSLVAYIALIFNQWLHENKSSNTYFLGKPQSLNKWKIFLCFFGLKTFKLVKFYEKYCKMTVIFALEIKTSKNA